jgi:hypothetical protein
MESSPPPPSPPRIQRLATNEYGFFEVEWAPAVPGSPYATAAQLLADNTLDPELAEAYDKSPGLYTDSPEEHGDALGDEMQELLERYSVVPTACRGLSLDTPEGRRRLWEAWVDHIEAVVQYVGNKNFRPE